jgi:NADP-dependent 3-hydroxy acid dehydrogenase YdfG
MNNTLENQVAIITGIAAATASANAGAKLVVVGRSVDNLEQLQKEIPNILPVAIDLVTPGAAKEVVCTLEH